MSLILSHHSRFACECNKEEINDDDDDFRPCGGGVLMSEVTLYGEPRFAQKLVYLLSFPTEPLGCIPGARSARVSYGQRSMCGKLTSRGAGRWWTLIVGVGF